MLSGKCRMKGVFSTVFMKPDIAVLGAFRSGTNYVRFLLEKNFRCDVHFNSYSWKHGPVLINARHDTVPYLDMPVVAVVKEPFSFCVSLYRYFMTVGLNIDAAKDWDGFLRSPITIFNKDKTKSPHYRFANPIAYWNFLNWNLTHLPGLGERAFFLRYETLLEDPEKPIVRIADRLGLKSVTTDFVTPSEIMKRMGEGRRQMKAPMVKSQLFDDRLYLDAKYLENYSDAQEALVRSQFDPELMSHLGYTN